MHDVVHPSNGNRPVNPTGRQASHVVRLAWKLPARLRQPVQRKPIPKPISKPKLAPVRFERRPLTTKAIAGQHTSDVHLGTTPKIKVSHPPYVGSAAKAAPVTGKKIVSQPIKVPVARNVPVVPAERDVAYHFPKPAPPPTAPVSVSVWLDNKRPEKIFKKKIPTGRLLNLTLLILECTAAVGLVWNLQGLGRVTAAWSTITSQARGAYQYLTAARSALAETDFARSQQNFSDASQALGSTQAELDQALSSSKIIISRLDITGTVRSGQQMLAAGAALAEAGQAVAKAMNQFEEASPIGGSLVEAITASKQDLVAASQALAQADQALQQIASPFLPADVIQAVKELQQSVPQINQGLKTFLDSSDLLLSLLGADRGRQYLILFTNNHELRPIGGFIGSLGLVDIDRGRVENIDIQSVYNPDGQLKAFIAPPDPLLPITNRWYLRDANWFVSYPVSARKIASFFEKEGGPTVDGVITITPAVIQNLLAVSGPIEVPAYGVTVSAENFRAVIQREVTYEYDKQLNRPKQFLADLTPLLLNRLFSGQGASQLKIISALQQALLQKDLLLYFRDQQIQSRVEKAGLAGEFPPAQPGFFSINNANIGGHKSDQFIEQEIDYRSTLGASGEQEVTVTIRRTHHGPAERPLDVDYPTEEDPSQKANIVYQRVFVPLDAKLIEARGFTAAAQIPRRVEPQPELSLMPDADVAAWQQGQLQHESGTTIGQEAGYQFFANWQVTKPGETSIGLYRYSLPAISGPSWLNPAARLTAYFAKQPGQERTSLRASFDLPEATRIRHTVPTAGITQDSARTLVYRGEFRQDLLVGAVYVRE